MPSFVPLGIADYSGNSERGFVQFTYQIADNNAKELTLQIRDGSSVIFEEKITDANKLKQGEHTWKWDGFDSGGILDTAKLTQYENLNLYTIGVDSSNNYSRKKLDFSMRYDEVKWVDVKIDKNSKRIDVTLRVNLKDGGARGVECREVIHRDHLNPGMRTSKKVCPWDKIPEDEIKPYQPVIKSRKKSFEELKEMAIEAMNIHWSRRYTNTVGTVINNENWEIIVTAVNTTKNAMDDIDLTFNTNNIWGRSNNPGNVKTIKSFFANLLEYVPYVPLSETIFYNVGYVNYILKVQSDFNLKEDNWYYLENTSRYKNGRLNIDREFIYTCAHELGHTILKSYAELGGGSTDYSYKHKGTSDYSDKLSINKGGENYPLRGEIDLMKYYNNDPFYYDFDRIVAGEKDVLGLLWLTKLKIK
ncbi:hypothetical protein [Tenacibaculum mesophilum]|uniref:hypothetical protein n=1 Tax=Tenacibaculum mesophilum TaxID=104268 RepID=UPI002491110A|nr:hypothetical protein [Tenacibaculum mesophilum]